MGFFQAAFKNSPGVRQCNCFGPQREGSEEGATNRVDALLMNHLAAVLTDCLKMPIHLEDTHLEEKKHGKYYPFFLLYSEQ